MHMADVGGIGEWLNKNIELRSEKTAWVYGDSRWTYQEVHERVLRMMSVLKERGVRKGDRVAAILFNSPEFLEVLFACAKLGAIFVPINYRLSPEEVKFILNDSGAHLVFYHSSFARLLAPIRAETSILYAICSEFEGEGECLAEDEQYAALMNLSTCCAYEDIVSQSDTLLMMYTSGTTGKPKGALLSHGNVTWNAINMFLNEASIRTDDIVLTVAPMFHIGGLNVHTLPAFYQGATVVLTPKFDPVALLHQIEQEQVGHLFMIPAMWFALTKVPMFDTYDLSQLQTLVCGGAPCPIPVIEFFQKRHLRFLEGFGMTETAPNALILSSKDAIRKNGSVGKPLTHVKVRIVDEFDRDVPTGEIGELVLQGPNVFQGYWNHPNATKEALLGGWFHSGDLARQDEEGFYSIIDRKKDMLISGGENVYSTEVEQVLYRHPKVSEVAVVGVPDEKWGEIPLAVIVPKDSGKLVDIFEIDEFCRGKLAGFKIPKRVVVVAELPRNATGKVLKRVLRDRYGN